MGKLKLKKPRTINGTQFKFINKFSLITWNFQDGGRVADFRLPSHLTEGFVTENRAQNKLEYRQTAMVFVPARKLSNKNSEEILAN